MINAIVNEAAKGLIRIVLQSLDVGMDGRQGMDMTYQK